MEPNNNDRVGRGFYELKLGLAPYVLQKFYSHHKNNTLEELKEILNRNQPRSPQQAQNNLRDMDPVQKILQEIPNLTDSGNLTSEQYAEIFESMDVLLLLQVMVNSWRDVFRSSLNDDPLSNAHALIRIRNQWAHQVEFDKRKARHAVESMYFLLRSIAARESSERTTTRLNEIDNLCKLPSITTSVNLIG